MKYILLLQENDVPEEIVEKLKSAATITSQLNKGLFLTFETDQIEEVRRILPNVIIEENKQKSISESAKIEPVRKGPVTESGFVEK